MRGACPRFQPIRELTIHHGRHTFCSHAAKLRTLAHPCGTAAPGCYACSRFTIVGPALAGHSNFATTTIYLHIATDDDGEVGGTFAFVR